MFWKTSKKESTFLVKFRRSDGVSLETKVKAEHASAAVHRAADDFQHIFAITDAWLVHRT